MYFQVVLVVKNLPANAGDTEEKNSNPFQNSCLGNPTDRETSWATVHGVTKSWKRLSDRTYNIHTHTHTHTHTNVH